MDKSSRFICSVLVMCRIIHVHCLYILSLIKWLWNLTKQIQHDVQKCGNILLSTMQQEGLSITNCCTFLKRDLHSRRDEDYGDSGRALISISRGFQSPIRLKTRSCDKFIRPLLRLFTCSRLSQLGHQRGSAMLLGFIIISTIMQRSVQRAHLDFYF